MSNPMTKEMFAEFSKHFSEYKAPDTSRWVGLTPEDRVAIFQSLSYSQYDTIQDHAERIMNATEAKLKEKNT